MTQGRCSQRFVGPRKGSIKKKLSFIGIGDSGRRDIAEKHEELIWERDYGK